MLKCFNQKQSNFSILQLSFATPSVLIPVPTPFGLLTYAEPILQITSMTQITHERRGQGWIAELRRLTVVLMVSD